MALHNDDQDHSLFGSPRATFAFWAGAGILLLIALALWQRHGFVMYVDMLATAIWSCF